MTPLGIHQDKIRNIFYINPENKFEERPGRHVRYLDEIDHWGRLADAGSPISTLRLRRRRTALRASVFVDAVEGGVYTSQ